MKLEVAKTVMGAEEADDRLFDFEIQVREEEQDEWSEAFVFQLSHDLAFEFTIPYGYQYRVSEADYSEQGYRTSVKADGESRRSTSVYEGTMETSMRVEFINTKVETAAVAEESSQKVSRQGGAKATLAGVGILCIVICLIIKRRLEIKRRRKHRNHTALML